MSPVGIIFVFFLIYVSVLGVLTLFLYGIRRSIPVMRPRHISDATLLRQSYSYALVLALAPVIFVASASIGRAGVYEIVLVAIFEIIACFYVAKHK